jgi:hypothetical protein
MAFNEYWDRRGLEEKRRGHLRWVATSSWGHGVWRGTEIGNWPVFFYRKEEFHVLGISHFPAVGESHSVIFIYFLFYYFHFFPLLLFYSIFFSVIYFIIQFNFKRLPLKKNAWFYFIFVFFSTGELTRKVRDFQRGVKGEVWGGRALRWKTQGRKRERKKREMEKTRHCKHICFMWIAHTHI